MLSKAQIDQFWRDGCLVVPDAVTPGELRFHAPDHKALPKRGKRKGRRRGPRPPRPESPFAALRDLKFTR